MSSSPNTPVRTGATSLNGAALVAKALTLIGTPYQLGGRRAHNGLVQFGLDCSEFTAWVYEQFGVALPWNAQQQYNAATLVSAPAVGDLVFFHGTDPSNPDPISHVGIYIGGGRMVNAQDNGVQVADLSSPYWVQHLAGYGRVANVAGGPAVVPLATGGSTGKLPGILAYTPQGAARFAAGVIGVGLVIDALLLIFAPQVKAGAGAVVKYGKYLVAA